MLARPYHFSDAKALDAILQGKGITTPGVDEIFVLGERGKPHAMCAYRPGAFVHEMAFARDAHALRRVGAAALLNYAVAVARNKPAPLASAIFLVSPDNLPMLRWLKETGAVLQSDPGDLLYTLTPP